jgi:hypothetical protein
VDRYPKNCGWKMRLDVTRIGAWTWEIVRQKAGRWKRTWEIAAEESEWVDARSGQGAKMESGSFFKGKRT